MSEPLDLTILVLACDEARHIERCIASVGGLAARVLVVDSASTDATRELARAGADVLEHDWTSHAAQLNWAFANAGIATTWTFRLDADEIVLPELADALRRFIAARATPPAPPSTAASSSSGAGCAGAASIRCGRCA